MTNTWQCYLAKLKNKKLSKYKMTVLLFLQTDRQTYTFIYNQVLKYIYTRTTWFNIVTSMCIGYFLKVNSIKINLSVFIFMLQFVETIFKMELYILVTKYTAIFNFQLCTIFYDITQKTHRTFSIKIVHVHTVHALLFFMVADLCHYVLYRGEDTKTCLLVVISPFGAKTRKHEIC